MRNDNNSTNKNIFPIKIIVKDNIPNIPTNNYTSGTYLVDTISELKTSFIYKDNDHSYFLLSLDGDTSITTEKVHTTTGGNTSISTEKPDLTKINTALEDFVATSTELWMFILLFSKKHYTVIRDYLELTDDLTDSSSSTNVRSLYRYIRAYADAVYCPTAINSNIHEIPLRLMKYIDNKNKDARYAMQGSPDDLFNIKNPEVIQQTFNRLILYWIYMKYVYEPYFLRYCDKALNTPLINKNDFIWTYVDKIDLTVTGNTYEELVTNDSKSLINRLTLFKNKFKKYAASFPMDYVLDKHDWSACDEVGYSSSSYAAGLYDVTISCEWWTWRVINLGTYDPETSSSNFPYWGYWMNMYKYYDHTWDAYKGSPDGDRLTSGNRYYTKYQLPKINKDAIVFDDTSNEITVVLPSSDHALKAVTGVNDNYLTSINHMCDTLMKGAEKLQDSDNVYSGFIDTMLITCPPVQYITKYKDLMDIYNKYLGTYPAFDSIVYKDKTPVHQYIYDGEYAYSMMRERIDMGFVTNMAGISSDLTKIHRIRKTHGGITPWLYAAASVANFIARNTFDFSKFSEDNKNVDYSKFVSTDYYNNVNYDDISGHNFSDYVNKVFDPKKRIKLPNLYPGNIPYGGYGRSYTGFDMLALAGLSPFGSCFAIDASARNNGYNPTRFDFDKVALGIPFSNLISSHAPDSPFTYADYKKATQYGLFIDPTKLRPRDILPIGFSQYIEYYYQNERNCSPSWSDYTSSYIPTRKCFAGAVNPWMAMHYYNYTLKELEKPKAAQDKYIAGVNKFMIMGGPEKSSSTSYITDTANATLTGYIFSPMSTVETLGDTVDLDELTWKSDGGLVLGSTYHDQQMFPAIDKDTVSDFKVFMNSFSEYRRDSWMTTKESTDYFNLLLELRNKGKEVSTGKSSTTLADKYVGSFTSPTLNGLDYIKVDNLSKLYPDLMATKPMLITVDNKNYLLISVPIKDADAIARNITYGKLIKLPQDTNRISKLNDSNIKKLIKQGVPTDKTDTVTNPLKITKYKHDDFAIILYQVDNVVMYKFYTVDNDTITEKYTDVLLTTDMRAGETRGFINEDTVIKAITTANSISIDRIFSKFNITRDSLEKVGINRGDSNTDNANEFNYYLTLNDDTKSYDSTGLNTVNVLEGNKLFNSYSVENGTKFVDNDGDDTLIIGDNTKPIYLMLDNVYSSIIRKKPNGYVIDQYANKENSIIELYDTKDLYADITWSDTPMLTPLYNTDSSALEFKAPFNYNYDIRKIKGYNDFGIGYFRNKSDFFFDESTTESGSKTLIKAHPYNNDRFLAFYNDLCVKKVGGLNRSNEFVYGWVNKEVHVLGGGLLYNPELQPDGRGSYSKNESPHQQLVRLIILYAQWMYLDNVELRQYLLNIVDDMSCYKLLCAAKIFNSLAAPGDESLHLDYTTIKINSGGFGRTASDEENFQILLKDTPRREIMNAAHQHYMQDFTYYSRKGMEKFKNANVIKNNRYKHPLFSRSYELLIYSDIPEENALVNSEYAKLSNHNAKYANSVIKVLLYCKVTSSDQYKAGDKQLKELRYKQSELKEGLFFVDIDEYNYGPMKYIAFGLERHIYTEWAEVNGTVKQVTREYLVATKTTDYQTSVYHDNNGTVTDADTQPDLYEFYFKIYVEEPQQ